MALVQNILARGDNVIATGRSASQFHDLLSDPSIDQTRLRVLALDVTAPFAEIKRQIDTAIGFWGRLDVVVNNAGICAFGTTEEIGSVGAAAHPTLLISHTGQTFCRAEGMMHVMNTNFFGSVNVTNAILPHMRGRREGYVVFIGSRSAFRNQLIVRVLPSNTSDPVLTLEFDRPGVWFVVWIKCGNNRG